MIKEERKASKISVNCLSGLSGRGERGAKNDEGGGP
jgi:hypothetical protein